MNNLLIDELIRFTHPEKTYGYPVAWAAFFGLDEAAYQEIRDRFGENARDAALEPLEDPDLASCVVGSPFRTGDTVLRAITRAFVERLSAERPGGDHGPHYRQRRVAS
jgi:hypothetical protein